MKDIVLKSTDKLLRDKYLRFKITNRQKNNTVLLINKYPNTMDGISKNISHFFFKKTEIGLNDISQTKLLKEIAKHKYIFVDHELEVLKSIKLKNKKVCYITPTTQFVEKMGNEISGCSNYNQVQNTRIFSNFTDVIVDNKVQKEQLIKAFGCDDDKIRIDGCVKMDIYNGNKFMKEVESTMIHYPETLTEISVLYVPKCRERKIDNLPQIKFLNNLHKVLGEKIKIYYSIEERIKPMFAAYDINASLINLDEVPQFLKICNLVISDYTSYSNEAKLIGSDYAHFCYDIEKFELYDSTILDEKSNYITEDELIEFISTVKFEANTSSVPFNHNTINSVSRKIVFDVIGKFK